MSGHYRYQPGTAHLAVSPTCGVLTPDAALASRLWPLIVQGSSLSGLLEEALRDGLAELPDLMLFGFEGDVLRVVVRGDLTARVQSAGGPAAEYDGRGVRTWNEQGFQHPVLLRVGELTDAGLPLGSGSVLAAAFRWTADGTSSEVAPSEDGDNRTPVAMAVAMSKHSAPVVAAVPPAAAPPVPVATEPAPRTGLPDTRVEPVDDSFEHLFESTVMRSVEDAAVRAPEEELPVIAPGPALDPTPTPNGPDRATGPGDHDGSTVMAGELAALLGSTGDPSPTATAATGRRPPVLQLSTGQSVEVDRSVVIGRRPQVDRVSGTEIPHLITVPSPQQDISRSHVAVRPGAASCVAVDLGSTNGSVIRRVGGAQVILAAGAILDLQFGDTIDLGDGVTATLLAPS